MNERRQLITPGTIIHDRYRIEEKIGFGGFSITYKAVDVEKDIHVAIKQFAPVDESVRWEHEKERFVREARILREFDYLEGVVSVRDVFEDDNTAYIVMEYIDGITVKEYVDEYGAFSWDELVKMVTPIIRSLAKIHRRNVTHYDISPDNLMIGMDNKLRLIDFGASKHVDVRSERTVIIKQGYAPVEQYYSDGGTSDGKIGSWSDVYALAATMYMALTGKVPIPAVERLENKDDSQEKDILNNILKDWQQCALLKGMAVNKSDRYENMEDFLEGISFPPTENGNYTRVISNGQSRKAPDILKLAGLSIILVIAVLLGLLLGQRLNLRKGMESNSIVSDENTEKTEVNARHDDTDKSVNDNDGDVSVKGVKDESSDDVSTEMSGSITEETIEKITGKTTEKTAENTTEKTVKNSTEKAVENTTEKVTEKKTVKEKNTSVPDKMDWSDDDDELY